MDTGAEPPHEERVEPNSKMVRNWAKHVNRLHIARHLALAPPFGMAVACGVLTVVGIVLAIVKVDLGPLSAVPHVLVSVAGFGWLGWAATPRIERALTDAAEEPAAWKCPALIEAACGLPLVRRRLGFEARLAECLRLVTREWWDAHSATMRNAVTQMLVTYETPSRLRPVDGPALPALFEAIARCERTELLKRVEGFERAVAAAAYPDQTRAAVRACGDALRARAKRDREAATLLRPVESPPDTLLRPLQTAAPRGDSLLVRPFDESQESGRLDGDTRVVEAAADAPIVEQARS
jgi:hypothetical protein